MGTGETEQWHFHHETRLWALKCEEVVIRRSAEQKQPLTICVCVCVLLAAASVVSVECCASAARSLFWLQHSASVTAHRSRLWCVRRERLCYQGNVSNGRDQRNLSHDETTAWGTCLLLTCTLHTHQPCEHVLELQLLLPVVIIIIHFNCSFEVDSSPTVLLSMSICGYVCMYARGTTLSVCLSAHACRLSLVSFGGVVIRHCDDVLTVLWILHVMYSSCDGPYDAASDAVACKLQFLTRRQH